MHIYIYVFVFVCLYVDVSDSVAFNKPNREINLQTLYMTECHSTTIGKYRMGNILH